MRIWKYRMQFMPMARISLQKILLEIQNNSGKSWVSNVENRMIWILVPLSAILYPQSQKKEEGKERKK